MHSPSRGSRRHRNSLGIALLATALAVLIATGGFAPVASAAVVGTAPVVKTEGATTIAQTTATLTATVNPGGLQTVYFFQYGPTIGYGSQTTLANLPAGAAPVGVNSPITGLVAKTVYHFRVEAINALGTTLGADASFTTAAPPAAPAPKPPVAKPPVVKTGAARAVGAASATLAGTVNPSAQPTTYFFQYGPTTAYGNQSPASSLAAGSATDPVSAAIGGLAAATKYHYRLVAANAAGKVVGADATFTTLPIALSIAIRAVPSPVTSGAPLSLTGTITGTGAPGHAVALQQSPYPFTTGFQTIGNPQVTSATGGFQFNLPALAATTQFRAVGLGTPAVTSPIVTERVALAVTMAVTVKRTRTRAHSFSFSGSISPAENGARVSLQRLVDGHWMRVTLTTADTSTTSNSSYSITLRRRHGGFFRVHVTPVEAGHVPGVSGAQLIHARVTV
jgi:hypothetical protein